MPQTMDQQFKSQQRATEREDITNAVIAYTAKWPLRIAQGCAPSRTFTAKGYTVEVDWDGRGFEWFDLGEPLSRFEHAQEACSDLIARGAVDARVTEVEVSVTATAKRRA